MKRGAVVAAALLAAFTAAALLATLIGCRKREAATSTAVEIARSGQNVTIRTADGTAAVGGAAALPSNFPKDIPMYPGAHLTASLEAGGAAAGHAVTIESSDWPDDVAKFYQAKLSGWKAAMDMKTADGRTLILRCPDGKRSFTLTATREALKTVATLTVASP